VTAKGLTDELRDRGYLVVDGIDGKAHYLALPPKSELAQYPMGAVVEVKGSADIRITDKTIAALSKDGLYRTDHHLAIAQRQSTPDRTPQEIVTAHVRRLEVLRRAGIVERVIEGVWKIPSDLPERGRQYDAQRTGGVAVDLKSHLPIERQTRLIGATWLDQQLFKGGKGLGDLGFGSEVKHAMQQRADFLVEQGLTEKRGQRITGIYRRNIMLASGRYAMLDDGMGFTLVPWKPVIEQRFGEKPHRHCARQGGFVGTRATTQPGNQLASALMSRTRNSCCPAAAAYCHRGHQGFAFVPRRWH